MGTKASKRKGSKAKPESESGKLRQLIEGVIDSQRRGDANQREAALDALRKFQAGASPELRQQVVEARVAAESTLAADRVRLLGEIAARVAPGR
jgi:hypothetical protein